MTEDTNVAASWLEGLAARGVTVAIRNGRLWLRPASAYKNLTDDEIITLRHHRAAIKALVADVNLRPTLDTTAEAGADLPVKAPEPAPAPTPEICPFCMRPCVGQEHPAFRTLHHDEEQEIWRRRAGLREKDAREWELRRRYGLPSPTWD